MSQWGRRASRTYLIVCALALLAMLVETVLGHPGTGSMIAAILAAPWSMLMAGLAPPLPRDWPLAAGLAVRMLPLALFMLLNSAIVRGIASRSERDLSRTATRVSLLLLLAAPLGSGCILSSRQEVFVVAPTDVFFFFSGGRNEIVFTFDLSTSPQWADHHADIAGVSDLAILGGFFNDTEGGADLLGSPLDVKVALAPTRLSTLEATPVVWGPLHLGKRETKRLDWSAGQRLMLGQASALGDEIRGDGKFTLFTVTATEFPVLSGVDITGLRLAAVLELK